jgi:hypothetical protein
VYGLTKNPVHPYHPIGIIFHEWKQLLKDLLKPNTSLSIKFNYLFKPPGWSHDATTQTADEMRKALTETAAIE